MSRKKAIHRHYEPRIQIGRENYDILDWSDARSQRARFEVLADRVDLAGRSLLDVGCGLGDLWAFLKERGLPVRYTGVDLVARMVQEARRRQPDATFLCADVFADAPPDLGTFDVVFGSGVFNLELGNTAAFLPRAVRRLLDLAGQTVVVNLLHHRAEPRYGHCAYHDPRDVLNLLTPLPCRIEIIDDYLPNDFTVICRKVSESE